ncbi:MAG: glycosyltransferase [Thermodesulfobacteriota bacterium]
MTAPTFSLCLIARNEERNLPRSLGPVRACFDEMVVVDTGSTDRTVDLARSYGAKVVRMEWSDDFAAARNVSLKAASGDWILWLDADNHISSADVTRIRQDLDHQGRTIFWCTEVVIPSGERLIQKRVFPRRPDVYFAGRVHEQLVHPRDFRSLIIPVEILHWGYADKVEARQKGRRNLRLLEAMAAVQPPDLYLCYQLGRTLFNLRSFEEALNWLDQAAAKSEAEESNPGLWRHAWILKAQALERLGRETDAEEVLRRLIASSPDYGPGHYWLGRRLYDRSEWNEAAASLNRFLNLGVGDAIAGFNPRQLRFTAAMLLGRCREKAGQDAEAAEAYRAASACLPDHLEPTLALVHLARTAGRIEEALFYLDRCLKIRPDDRRAIELRRDIETRV